MKKNIVFILLALSGMGLFACHAKGVQETASPFIPDSTVYKILGKSLSEILFNPSRVRCYAVKNVAQPRKEELAFDQNFVCDTLISKLTKEETAILHFLLLSSPDNYHESAAKVRSPYFPNLAFEFKKNRRVAYVLVSLSDFSWSIYYDDKIQFNYNYTNADVIARFCNYYIQLKKGGKKK